MAYIGYNPSQLAVAPFATKNYTGDGTTTTFTLDQSVPGANEANVQVVVENVIQNPIDAYTISGSLNNQLVFSEAPVSGAAIYVIHKGEATYNLQPSTGSVTSATLDPVLRNFTVDTFAGNGSTATFTLTDTPYSANSILVTVDGITQTAGTNYTVSGTTLDFGTDAPASGSVITVVHLGFSSGNKSVMDGSITPVKLSTGAPSWNTSGTMFIGTSTALGGATNPIVAMYASANNYVQTYVLNRSTGSGASADLVAYPDNGTDSSGWIDMGITSSTFSSTPFGITGANEGYLFMSAPSGAGKSGNMVIATDSTGSSNAIIFATNGFTAGTEKMRITSGGNVGINASSPTAHLEVAAPTGSSSLATMSLRSDRTGLQNHSGIYFRSKDNYIKSTVLGYGTNDNTGGSIKLTTVDSAGVDRERFSIDSNGLVTLPYGQIKFPASQNASADANTLDDYEEGTFTPILSADAGGTFTQTIQHGQYVKIGKVVHFNVYVTWSAYTGSGSVQLNNWPFSIDWGTSRQRAGSMPVTSCSYATSQGYVFKNDTNGLVNNTYLYNFTDTSIITASLLGSTGFIVVRGHYFTST